MSDLEPKPGQSNWDYCMRRAAAIDKDDLIRCLLRQIETMSKKKRLKYPLWYYVGQCTSHGCGISTAIVQHYLPDHKGTP